MHQIHAARERIREAIYLSPCARSELLSERSGCDLFLKLENLQMSGSFKERGACNRLELLGARERAAGVVAASAGNHAQGLAWHARRLGMECVVVMPVGTPLVKQVATQRFGAEVRLEGRDYDEACVCARRLEQERGLTFIHAFDDLEVMAGQGTIGMELIEQVDRLDAVVVPVGGGGLAAGVAVAVKALRPSVEVYGVEAGAVPSMTWARREGRPGSYRSLHPPKIHVAAAAPSRLRRGSSRSLRVV